MQLSFFLLVLFTTTAIIWALPQGAPPKICSTMLPNHPGSSPQTDPSPYSVQARSTTEGIEVTVASALGVPFQGLMLQGRSPAGQLMGSFHNVPEGVHTIDCDVAGDTVTHNEPQPKESVVVLWRAPEGYKGPVIFNATIASDFSTFWVGVESRQIQVGAGFNLDEGIAVTTPSGRPRTTTPPYYKPNGPPEAVTTPPDAFYNGCGATKLCFGAPADCVKTKTCKAAAAVIVIGDRYEFEMKANGNANWVGVGLSEDAKMGDDSVMECVKRGNNVATYMSWTSGPPNKYGATRLNNAQLGIQLLNSSIVDDTIYCKVERQASTTVKGKIFDLVNQKYHLLVASGSSVKPTGVNFHDLAFAASGEPQALSDVSALAAASKLLVRLHGSFMLAAWIGTASVGVLLARYFRTTWVGSSVCGKDIWFAWHRMLMVLTWALTVTGFVLIFVELRAWSAENNPHAILGTVTTIICCLQPIGAYFRPHPGTSKRPIFNWVHWLGGNAAHIIAIVTIFFAVKLTKAELPEWMDWILVAFVVLHVIVHLVLSIMGCVSEKSSEKRVTSFPMKDLGGSGRSSAYADRNPDSPYSGFRKFMLGIYILLVLGIVVALIVVTALAPIEQTWDNLKNSVMKT